MGQLIFMAICLLIPRFADWTERMRQGEGTNEAGRDERGRGTDEGHGGE